MHPNKILVATDFSQAAPQVMQRAISLAKIFGAELRLIHVVPTPMFFDRLVTFRRQWDEEVHARASRILHRQAARIAGTAGIEVSTALLAGSASVAITKAIDQYRPDLVVVGTHGQGRAKSGLHGLGQTAAKLLRKSHAPLLLVRGASQRAYSRVLGAIDFSPPSPGVIRWTCRLAPIGRAAFIHVFELPFAKRFLRHGVAQETLDAYGIDELARCENRLNAALNREKVDEVTARLVVRGEAVRTITRHVRKLKSDLIVIGKHRRHKRDAADPYGSVCHYLCYFLPIDILVVP